MNSIENNIQLFLEDYFSHFSFQDDGAGSILSASERLYESTGNTVFKEYVLNALTQLISEKSFESAGSAFPSFTAPFSCAKALFFAEKETGRHEYRAILDTCMKNLTSLPRTVSGLFCDPQNQARAVSLQDLYAILPFYMAYEKQYNHFGNLSDISDLFSRARKQVFPHTEEAAPDRASSEKNSLGTDLSGTGWYLLTLIDCIDLCDEQLYEHYRLMIDLFREAVHSVIRSQNQETGSFFSTADDGSCGRQERFATLMIVSALLKAVRLGVLNEKYVKHGIAAFDTVFRSEAEITNEIFCLRDHGHTDEGETADKNGHCLTKEDTEITAMFINAYTEMMYVRK